MHNQLKLHDGVYISIIQLFSKYLVLITTGLYQQKFNFFQSHIQNVLKHISCATSLVSVSITQHDAHSQERKKENISSLSDNIYIVQSSSLNLILLSALSI